MTLKFRMGLALAAGALGACWSWTALAADEAGEAQPSIRTNANAFVRVVRDARNRPRALETALVRYTAAGGASQGVTVDLIGAVHIGEKAYYDRLNKEFERYDAVLYELVAPPDAQVPKPAAERTPHPVSLIQQGMKNLLELEFQLDQIDYRKTNFVHADMSPKQLSESMAKRGESFWTLFLRVLTRAMDEQDDAPVTSDLDILKALFNNDRALSLKRLMAAQFENSDVLWEVLGGPDGSSLLTERNKVALRVLSKQIEAGKKRIAIFYGAGHLPDFEGRLAKDFGLRRQSERWLVAWDLRSKAQRRRESGGRTAE